MNLALKGQRGPPPCPVAIMARKNKCLGPACAWHVPDTETGCIVLEDHIQIVKMIGILTLIKDCLNEIDSKMNAALKETGTLIKTETVVGGDENCPKER